MSHLEVAPAYGRDYTSQAKVKADWAANKDFIVTEGGPFGTATNKEDIDRMPGVKVVVRYAKQTKVVAVN